VDGNAMGTLRFTLALSVAYAHAGSFFGFFILPPYIAVESFYAVSGFYMALVLSGKYSPAKSTYWLFLTNRFSRLLPSYLIVLALTLALATVVHAHGDPLPEFMRRWTDLSILPFHDLAYMVGAQLSLIAQDGYIFLRVADNSLAFTPFFLKEKYSLVQFLVVPQSWTLGLEIWFYSLAPFIVRRSVGTIVVLLFASLALRFILQFSFGYYGDPWLYRFFPSEIALFLAGVLGYRVYAHHKPQESRAIEYLVIAAACLITCLTVSYWQASSRKSHAILALVICAIPFLFHYSKNARLDRHLGELSYPLYICHFLVIWTVDAFGQFDPVPRGLGILAGSIMLSAALYGFIDRPVNGWRQRRLLISAPDANIVSQAVTPRSG
jgi:peptidoglycan/LPS O-acetylase OafA/YrhL